MSLSASPAVSGGTSVFRQKVKYQLRLPFSINRLCGLDPGVAKRHVSDGAQSLSL